MYYRKRFIVILLIVFSAIFIGLLMFSNNLVEKLKAEEKNNIALWVNAVQKRSQLIENTKVIFDRIDSMESSRAQIFASVYQRIIDIPNYVDMTFYEQLINSNTTIPYILTDEDYHINASRNVSEEYLKSISTAETLKQALEEERYETIPILYLPGKYIYLHYKESNLSVTLRELLVENFESFTNDVIRNAPSVPVIVTDTTRSMVYTFGNVDSNIIRDPKLLAETLRKMQRQLNPFRIRFGPNTAYVYYEESTVLKMTRIFPFILGCTIVIFFIILIIILLYSRQAERNRLWTGLTKETAHQLGTPISALMAWTEILKSEQVNPEIITEIEKDVERLNVVSRRFSNIESTPELERMDIVERIHHFISYFKTRISGKITIELQAADAPLYANLNGNLFEWVLENMGKNAVDAMEGEGFIRISCGKEKKSIWIDMQDNGKGMSRKNARRVFMPGFTTKTRGWGVGMTLCQRIIQSYHHGKIEVRRSEPGKGTTFRITLPEA